MTARAPGQGEGTRPRAAISLPELSAPAAKAPPPAGSTPISLEDQAARIAHNAVQAEAPPMPSRDAIAAQEFQNLAVLHHKLVERVATLEADITKMKRDQQDMKAIIGRKLMK